MLVETQVNINASKEAVWAIITNIENAASILSGVEKIEIVERPANGLIGLRWRETRMYFGKPATVEKQITEAVETDYYKTRAESDGFLFLSKLAISDAGNAVTLTSTHDSQPQGFISKLKATPMIFFKGMLRKALTQDLNDIKTAVEKK